MVKYQQLYKEGASQEDLNAIKATLTSRQVLTWEECYWATKCLVKHDTSDCNPRLLIKTIQKAFRGGLSMHNDPDVYWDALSMIATFCGVSGKYDQAINYLINYTSAQNNAPDWAYHDLIAAQIHTDQIIMMIETPKLFLKDLARNDTQSPTIAGKQKNLLRDFLCYAADCIRENRQIRVAFLEIKDAAEKYGLLDTEAWSDFLEANRFAGNSFGLQSGANSTATKAKRNSGLPIGKNVVPLFPEAEDISPEHNKQLDVQAQSEIEKNAALNDKKRLTNELQSVRQDFDDLAKKYEEATVQIEELKKQGSLFDAAQKDEALPSDMDIVGRSYYYLNIVCLDAGRAWLKRMLPKLSKDYMRDYFFPALTNFQLNIAYENGWSKIEDFDLSAIVRVIKRNLYKISSFSPDKSDERTIDNMLDIRNTWGAHNVGTKFDYKQIAVDIYIMSDFIDIVDGSQSVIDEMRTFADKIPQQQQAVPE